MQQTISTFLDGETVRDMKETLGESFAQLARYHFICNDNEERDAYDTILSSLSNFHTVLTLAQKQRMS